MQKLPSKKLHDWLFAWSVYLIPALSFLVFWLYINLNSIILAFQGYDVETGLVGFVGLENFAKIFEKFNAESSILFLSLRNSLINYVVGLLCFGMSLIFSFYLFKKFLGHKLIRAIVMLPNILSSFIICLVVKKLIEDGFPMLAAFMGNTKFPKLLTDENYAYMTTVVYSIWLSFSGYCIIIPNAMNAIEPEIIESAHIDGTNLFQEYYHFVLPLIFPTISTFLITGVSSILVGLGPLVEFYIYDAPPSTYNVGYYMTVQTMTTLGTAQAKIIYPEIAALGLFLTAITAPVVFGVKKFLNKFDYTEDRA